MFDGAGSTLAPGLQGDVSIAFGWKISGWVLLADVVGTSSSISGRTPTGTTRLPSADKITGSLPPTISSDDQARSTVLTGWTKQINAGDSLRFNVTSASAITRVALTLSLL